MAPDLKTTTPMGMFGHCTLSMLAQPDHVAVHLTACPQRATPQMGKRFPMAWGSTHRSPFSKGIFSDTEMDSEIGIVADVEIAIETV